MLLISVNVTTTFWEVEGTGVLYTLNSGLLLCSRDRDNTNELCATKQSSQGHHPIGCGIDGVTALSLIGSLHTAQLHTIIR